MTTIRPHASADFSIYARHVEGRVPGNYIAGLDGLRAISVAMVVIAHSGFGNIVPGGFGVTVFFFISGFLITNLLISEWVGGSINLRNFYIRRYLRLSPELFAYILIGTIINALFFDIRVIDVIAGLFYFTNYLDIVAISQTPTPFEFAHFWSLAVEEHFYLLAPFVMFAFRRQLDRYVYVIVAICALVPFYRWFASVNFFPEHLTGGASAYTYYASEARLDSILYGCLLAMVARFQGRRLLDLSNAQAIVALGAALAVLVASFLLRDYHFRSVWRYSVQGVALLAVFYVLYFSALGGRILKLLEKPAMTFLGRMSYGIYIWHLMPIFVITQTAASLGLEGSLATRLVTVVIAFATSTAIATVSARYVLGPVSSLRRRFGSHGHLPQQPGSARLASERTA